MSEYNIFNGWDDKPDAPYFKILDEWFSSSIYEGIARDADVGCKDSIEAMDKINGYLDSAAFHLNTGKSRQRIDYELSQFADYVKEYLN